MTDAEFDDALLSAALAQAAITGWRRLSVVDAARSAGLPLDQARARFPGPTAVAIRLGLRADQAALAIPPTEPAIRDRLFDLIMRRLDIFQAHRDGVLALIQGLPLQPGLALLIANLTVRSMAWLFEAAGGSAQGWRGQLKVQALTAVWVYTFRAWERDDSVDLSATMAALDKALDRAERMVTWLDQPEMGPEAAMPADEAPAEDPPDVPPPPPPPPEPPASPPDSY